MAYLNVDEIEVAIETLARAHPNVTELIPLPNVTSEGILTRCASVRQMRPAWMPSSSRVDCMPGNGSRP